MILKEGRRNGLRHRSLDRFGDDTGLVFAPGHQHELLRAENGSDTHRDGKVWHVLLAAEVAGGVLARHAVQRDAARERVAAGAGFIEADVTRSADAENLKVDATERINLLLVVAAMGEDLVAAQRAAGDVDVRLRDVDVIKNLLRHEARVAFRMIRREAEVFVEVEGDDVLEAEPFLFVQADQLAIKRHRRRSRGHAEHGGLPGFVFRGNDLLHLLRERLRRRSGVGEDDSRDFFKGFGR